MAAIKKAEGLAAGFKFVATGHGPVGTVKDVTAWREYFDGFDWVPLNVLGMYHFLTDSR